MPTASVSKNVSMPTPHESSVIRSPRDADDVRQAWKRAAKQQDQIRGNQQSVENLTRLVEKIRRRILGGSVAGAVGWHRPSNRKYEVDPTFNYDESSVIHIQPTDSLVTAGIRDAANPTGALVQSCAGYWVATQDVPAKTTVSGNDVWNLPQYPLPVPTDIDDPTNFWIYLGEAMP